LPEAVFTAREPGPIPTQKDFFAMADRPTAAVILAAGLGKRMCSSFPKVLHPVLGEPMIDHVLRAVETAGVKPLYMITGHQGMLVQAYVGARATCIDQPERLGTGHAVMQAEKALADFDGDVIVTCGDTPLITADTFKALVARRAENPASAGIVLTAVLDDPTGYGRIVRAVDGSVTAIVEEKDASAEQRAIGEVNTGTYCFNAKLLFQALKRVKNENAQGEYYLTDVLGILIGEGHAFDAVVAADPAEMIGVNSRAQLAECSEILRRRVLARLMDEGVTITDPATTIIDAGVKIGMDTTVDPFTIIRGATRIGDNCVIGPSVQMSDSLVGNRALVRQSILEGVEVREGEVVGPFAYRRYDQ
jgi:bifunctional UDP-N-acetylglucosamine pyrophosphorylase/glucosamine-1-phosphate N-acetyltransferase